MKQPVELISDAIDTVPDLSSRDAHKWDDLYPTIAKVLGVGAGDLYLTYINKAGNTQVRLSKQMPSDRHIRVAIGLCGGSDEDSLSYPNQSARAIASRKDLDLVIFMWKSDPMSGGRWEGRLCFHRPGATQVDLVREVWPDIRVREVASPPSKTKSIGEQDFADAVIRLLRDRKNVVLEGVPGTGKTFAVNEIVRRWQEVSGLPLAEPTVIVLHPSSSYEDLVEGLKPCSSATIGDFTSVREVSSDKQGFAATFGRFPEAALRAAADPNSDHLLILDEINRANVPKALGELMLVMESTKRARWTGSKWDFPADGVVRLTYTGARFWLPNNLHILATMNSSDRSVAPLDVALRRRFVFKRLEPLSPDQILAQTSTLEDDAEAWFSEVLEVWAGVNESLLRLKIGPDAVLGHSYLFDLHGDLLRGESTSSKKVIQDFLRYVYLPQLLDIVASNGREVEIFGTAKTELSSKASEAMTSLGVLLESVGLQLRLEGEGLSRRVSVFDVSESALEIPQLADQATSESG